NVCINIIGRSIAQLTIADADQSLSRILAVTVQVETAGIRPSVVRSVQGVDPGKTLQCALVRSRISEGRRNQQQKRKTDCRRREMKVVAHCDSPIIHFHYARSGSFTHNKMSILIMTDIYLPG